MSLVLTELSNAGIVMVADSAISIRNLETNCIEAHSTDWLKVIKVPKLKAGVAYWGTVGLISGSTPFDKFLQRIVEGAHYTTLEEFAEAIACALNKACKEKPLKDEAVGVHVAGYSRWSDGELRPTFYHVHNGHGEIQIMQQYDGSISPPRITRTTGEWKGEPSRLLKNSKII